MSKTALSKDKKSNPTTIILGLTFFSIIFCGFVFKESNSPKSADTYISNTPTQSTKKIFTFTLTHGMGQKLPKNASFTCGDTPVWTLDFNNGTKLKYTIIGTDSEGSLCGIKARDNLGDNCEICIISEGDGKMTLRLRYSEKTMIFKGYVN